MSIAATLLKQASSTLSRASNPEEAICEITQSIGQLAQLDQVRISIQNPFRGTSIVSSFDVPNPQPAAVALNSEFRAGHQTYGHVEIQASKPAMRAVELFQFVNRLEELLLNYAVGEAAHAPLSNSATQARSYAA